MLIQLKVQRKFNQPDCFRTFTVFTRRLFCFSFSEGNCLVAGFLWCYEGFCWGPLEERNLLKKGERIIKPFLTVLEFTASSVSWFSPTVWNSGSLSHCNWPIFSPLLSLSEEVMQHSGTILRGFCRLYCRCFVLLNFAASPPPSL